MSCQSVLVLCLVQVSLMAAAPLSMFLQPQQQLPMQQQTLQQLSMQSLQQLSMQPLQQQLQALQMMQPFQPLNLNIPRPIFMILPIKTAADNIPATSEKLFRNKNEKLSNKNAKLKDREQLEPHDDNEEENASVVIDAADVDDMSDVQTNQLQNMPQSQRIVMLDPQTGRFSIGQFIESIPWLPFEVNVPDSISWAWNGLTSIFAAIGTQLPFRQRLQDGSAPMQNTPALKLLMNSMDSKIPLMRTPVIPVPIIVIPMPMPMGTITRP